MGGVNAVCPDCGRESEALGAALARIEELEQALAVVPVLTAKLMEVEAYADALQRALKE